ncbi:hypothetical protein AA0119_g13421 [Alternaria tenuissima]|uniref:DDE-1 domain-containing protein n=1 Tax=Alternaria tenuissima TaxID=119927 RepID=A0ABY0FNP0_9PLEO|nr:hypothetical protein AA0119_g13421 [Alternaria tenuissima]RYO00075.1 hypothetical protein AA0121_g13438 [Alternaria tenuissima]
MAPRNVTQILSDEADIQLAILSVESGPTQKNRRAASIDQVPESTPRDRRAGKSARRDCQPNSKKLTKQEEQVIVNHLLDLDQCEFVPTYEAFKFVEETKAKYGICDEDVYNFDEAGFMMGKITTQIVVTASERRVRPKATQPGNREWVTWVAAINAAGWAVPPFLIFAGQYQCGQ